MSGSAEIAVTIFLIVNTLVVFALPFFIRVKNEFLSLMFGRLLWILSIFLAMLDTTVIIGMSSTAGIQASAALNFYLWLFGSAGYVLMIFVGFKTVIDVFQLTGKRKNEARFGTHEND